ncbi:Alpha/Beta hydrolase protein [Gymnopilus junonius]|uniref:Alpha/Beta hydrolase protein n=1 Tax=Gymnopilus junonius TaxID=109634 RepID=A0A9P5NVK4_GYMJU|nr:Alpha/Beta hydrolase protein [Gymnopilus junonius]
MPSLSLSVSIFTAIREPHRPSEYAKKTADCKAVRRAPVEENVDIQLKYVDVNPQASTTIVMVHGWPGLWSIWSNQIQEFKDDYHLIVPELRGYGESAHPGDTRSSGTMQDMVSDLVCVLKDAKVESAVCMGHDWGSAICYEAARSRPDVFTAVVGAVVPYFPASGPYVPMKSLVESIPSLGYQIFFDSQPEIAVAELDKDIRRTVRATLRTVDSPAPDDFLKSDKSFLAAWDGFDEVPPAPFFTAEEEDYFVEQYSIQGYKHTIQFYFDENQYLSWKHVHSQENYTIPQPVLAIYPTADPVADFAEMANLMKSADYLPNLTIEILHGSHWIQLENPREFNEAVRRWLKGLLPDGEKENQAGHDEL